MQVNKQILDQAIQKAIDGGWPFFEDSTLLPVGDWVVPNSICVYNSYLEEKMYIPQGVFIYSHDFAKALWPGKHTCQRPNCGDGGCTNEYEWQYHLQQMVIAEDAIKYLGQHI